MDSSSRVLVGVKDEDEVDVLLIAARTRAYMAADGLRASAAGRDQRLLRPRVSGARPIGSCVFVRQAVAPRHPCRRPLPFVLRWYGLSTTCAYVWNDT
jgi:hypothetical protein